jgi:hypothetical protein
MEKIAPNFGLPIPVIFVNLTNINDRPQHYCAKLLNYVELGNYLQDSVRATVGDFVESRNSRFSTHI